MSSGYTFYIRLKEMAIVIAIAIFLNILLILLLPADVATILLMAPIIILPVIYTVICFVLDRDLEGFRLVSIGFDLAVTFFAILIGWGLTFFLFGLIFSLVALIFA